MNESLEAHATSLRNDIKRLAEERESQKKGIGDELNSFIDGKNKLISQIDSLSKGKRNLEEGIKSLENKSRSLKDGLAALQAEIESCRKYFDYAISLRREKEDEITALEARLAGLREEERRFSAYSSRIAESRKQFEELEKLIKDSSNVLWRFHEEMSVERKKFSDEKDGFTKEVENHKVLLEDILKLRDKIKEREESVRRMELMQLNRSQKSNLKILKEKLDGGK